MISIQTIKTSIEELKAITKVDIGVYDPEGNFLVSTGNLESVSKSAIDGFATSPADSQVMGEHHLLKILDGDELVYVVDAVGTSEDTYMIGKIAVSSIRNLMIAYKEKFDKSSFFQNLVMDNLLLVDIYNRAKKLRIDINARRAAIIVESSEEKNSIAQELLAGMFSPQNGDNITSIDENCIILIKKLNDNDDYENIDQIAKTIVDMMSTEIMMNVRVAYGNIVEELKDVSKSYKEARMALDVGKIFNSEKRVSAYNSLGIGRLIYQLPENLCHIFVEEIFGNTIPEVFDEETLTTINKFFENNLNVSETSRQLFVHRNTLVYRIEKLHQNTGLDIRVFDDALTLKIALMVVNYMKYLEQQDY